MIAAVLTSIVAGLAPRSVRELQEAGLLPVIAERVWDVNPILPEDGLAGSPLKALFSYNGNPSLLEVVS